jgi:hypothetical protein
MNPHRAKKIDRSMRRIIWDNFSRDPQAIGIFGPECIESMRAPLSALPQVAMEQFPNAMALATTTNLLFAKATLAKISPYRGWFPAGVGVTWAQIANQLRMPQVAKNLWEQFGLLTEGERLSTWGVSESNINDFHCGKLSILKLLIRQPLIFLWSTIPTPYLTLVLP